MWLLRSHGRLGRAECWECVLDAEWECALDESSRSYVPRNVLQEPPGPVVAHHYESPALQVTLCMYRLKSCCLLPSTLPVCKSPVLYIPGQPLSSHSHPAMWKWSWAICQILFPTYETLSLN